MSSVILSGQGCPQLQPELSIGLTTCREEEKTAQHQTYKGLFVHLNGGRVELQLALFWITALIMEVLD